MARRPTKRRRPGPGQLRLPMTMPARPDPDLSWWSPGVPLYPQPGRSGPYLPVYTRPAVALLPVPGCGDRHCWCRRPVDDHSTGTVPPLVERFRWSPGDPVARFR